MKKSSIVYTLHKIILGKLNQVGRDEQVVQHAWEMRNISKVLVEKLERRRPPGRLRLRWENYIKNLS
jgi:hypothetical protein